MKFILSVLLTFWISAPGAASAGLLDSLFEGPYDRMKDGRGQNVVKNGVELVKYDNELFGFVGFLANNTTTEPMCYRIICTDPGYSDTGWQEVAPLKPGNRWSTGKQIIRVHVSGPPGQQVQYSASFSFHALPLPRSGGCSSYNGVVEKAEGRGWTVDRERFHQLTGLQPPGDITSIRPKGDRKAAIDPALLNAKVAFYDMNEVVQGSELGTKMRDELKKQFDAKKTLLETKKGEVEKRRKEIERQRVLLSPQEYERRRADYQKQVENFRTLSAKTAEELKATAEALTKDMEAKIAGAVASMKAAGGYDRVFEKNTALTVPYDPSKDITNLLVEEMNRSHPARTASLTPMRKPSPAPAGSDGEWTLIPGTDSLDFCKAVYASEGKISVMEGGGLVVPVRVFHNDGSVSTIRMMFMKNPTGGLAYVPVATLTTTPDGKRERMKVPPEDMPKHTSLVEPGTVAYVVYAHVARLKGIPFESRK